MGLERFAQHIASAHLQGVRRTEAMYSRAFSSEQPPGPATAQMLGILVMASAAKTTLADVSMRVVAKLDPWLLPPGVTALGLTTNQLADALLGLSPKDVADITANQSL